MCLPIVLSYQGIHLISSPHTMANSAQRRSEIIISHTRSTAPKLFLFTFLRFIFLRRFAFFFFIFVLRIQFSSHISPEHIYACHNQPETSHLCIHTHTYNDICSSCVCTIHYVIFNGARVCVAFDEKIEINKNENSAYVILCQSVDVCRRALTRTRGRERRMLSGGLGAALRAVERQKGASKMG